MYTMAVTAGTVQFKCKYCYISYHTQQNIWGENLDFCKLQMFYHKADKTVPPHFIAMHVKWNEHNKY